MVVYQSGQLRSQVECAWGCDGMIPDTHSDPVTLCNSPEDEAVLRLLERDADGS